ncbi:MAG: hypothetical protein Q8M40_08450 [Legionella sp.]|nr:hypothetical protein [Legionella sp.]
MPHLILEYSDNLNLQQKPLSPLFSALHDLLVTKLPTQLTHCKSRCISYPLYFIGDQNDKNAFVHLTVKILAGRSDLIKSEVIDAALVIINTFFKVHSELHIYTSVELIELNSHYVKDLA